MKERSERIAEKLRSTYRSEQAEKNKRKLVVLEQPPKIQRARRWGEPYKKPTVLSKIKRELSTHSSSAAPLSLTSSAVGGSSRSGSSSYVTDLGDKVKPHSSEDRISREDLEQSSALASAEFFKTSSSIAATSNSTTKSKPALTTTTSSLFLPKAKRAK